MKKIIYTTILFFVSTVAFTQVGVNNDNIPDGSIFYVNPTGTTTEKGGLTVTKEGNMGIGTSTPTQKLDVVGSMTTTLSDSIKGNLITNNNISIGEGSHLRILGNKNGNITGNLDTLKYNLEIRGKKLKEALRFDDGSQKVAAIANRDPLPVLTKNVSTNTVTWTDLPSITEFKSVNLLNKKPVQNSETIDKGVIISETPMVLTEGLWLVLASIPTDNTANSAAAYRTDGLYVYMILTEVNNPNTEIVRVGAASEYGAGFAVATPQLTYPLTVPPGGGSYNIKICTSIGASNNTSSRVYQTSTAYGSSYFYAIKLDYKN